MRKLVATIGAGLAIVAFTGGTLVATNVFPGRDHVEPTWPVPAAVGQLQVTPAGTVQAVFERIPPPATGWTYRLWQVEGTAWVSMDVEFNPEADGHTTVSVPGVDPNDVEEIFVSLEPNAGSAQPTTDQLFKVTAVGFGTWQAAQTPSGGEAVGNDW